MSDTARDRAIEAAGWLRSMVSTSSRDWGQASGDALIYGVLVGWSCPPDCDEKGDRWHNCDAAVWDLAARHGWTVATVEKMREHHAALRALAGEAGAAADWEGACVRLSREDWGVVIDALIEHRRSAERRKAGNSESTSDVRVETCVRLVAELGALLSVPPATAPARLRATLGVAPGS